MVEGDVKGIQMRFIDTPGLQLSPSKISYNQGILAQVAARRDRLLSRLPCVVTCFPLLSICFRKPCMTLAPLRTPPEACRDCRWWCCLAACAARCNWVPGVPAMPAAHCKHGLCLPSVFYET